MILSSAGAPEWSLLYGLSPLIFISTVTSFTPVTGLAMTDSFTSTSAEAIMDRQRVNITFFMVPALVCQSPYPPITLPASQSQSPKSSAVPFPQALLAPSRTCKAALGENAGGRAPSADPPLREFPDPRGHKQNRNLRSPTSRPMRCAKCSVSQAAVEGFLRRAESCPCFASLLSTDEGRAAWFRMLPVRAPVLGDQILDRDWFGLLVLLVVHD